MAYTVTAKQTFPGNLIIEVTGDDSESVAVALLDTYNRLTYKPDPVPTPDPPA